MFVRLTNNDRPMLLRIDLIASVESLPHGSVITTRNGKEISVQQSPDEIHDLLLDHVDPTNNLTMLRYPLPQDLREVR